MAPLTMLRLSAARCALSASRAPQLRRTFICSAARLYSSASVPTSASPTSKPSSVKIRGNTYNTHQDWFNVPSHLIDTTSRKLHLQKDHPVYITRQIIESNFPAPTYTYYNEHHPVVTTTQNFDSLGFPANHPGRALSDTYYINETTLLRTHTSAHQADTFKKNESDGYLISADVYRRDAIDRTHYPAFHQMEGARSWDRDSVPNGDIAAAVMADLEKLPKHDVLVEDPNPHHEAERNPVQSEHHTDAEADAIAMHLKRSLELMVIDVFTRAKAAAKAADPDFKDEPLKMRWVEAYFPFTSPSYELEVYYNGDWLEVLGSGVVKQDLYINADVPRKLGWAFGVGLDRIAMLLFNINDIRLFWSRDERFTSQFTGVSDNLDRLRRFVPFSKYPPSTKDVSFWLPSSSNAAGGGVKGELAENDVMELVRKVAGDVVEDVKKFDEYVDRKSGKKSQAFRIVYRSLEKTMTSGEVGKLHNSVRQALTDELGVTIR